MLKSRLFLLTLAFTLSACSSLPKAPSSPPVVESAQESSVTTAEGKTGEVKLTESPSSAGQHQQAQTISGTAAYDDVWLRIRNQLKLNRHLDKGTVKARLKWYAKHQAYLDRVAERATPYLFHIVETLEQRNMPLELALLPIVESAYHPFAYSRSHASGIWQFIPGTGRNYGLKQNWWYDGRRDIVAATDAALNYLEKLNKEFKGDWLHALAAYNTGERNVGRSISRNKRAGKPIDFWSLRLPRETRGYVPSLLAVAELLANPQKHGVSWNKINNQPYFSIVALGKQIDLATAAKLADMSMDEIYTLNPAFNRWATDPQGPHQLLIPVDKRDQFERNLAALPDSERISWKRHVIGKGESLGLIARKYHTSVSALKQTNKLQSNLIREGHSLLIPSARLPMDHYTLSMDSRRYRGLKKSRDGKSHLYTIRRGDTLWDIGRHYGVSVKQLCAWNGIHAGSILKPGKKLSLWIPFDEKNTAKALPASYEEDKELRYTVKKGDSLWLIARRFNTNVKKLTLLNKISKNKPLQPGQTLIIQKAPNKTTGA